VDGPIGALIRSVAVFFAMLLLTRILGKREISQLSFLDFITGITIGDIGANLSYNSEMSEAKGMISLLVWIFLPYTLSILTARSKKVRDLIDGQPTVVIQNGKVLEQNLARARYSVDDLLQQLRKKNIFRLADVEFAVLETSGTISVLQKTNAQPVTKQDVSLTTEQETQPHIVIQQGQVDYDGLMNAGFTPQWLMGELEKQGVLLGNVSLGQVDSKGNLYVDLYQDKLQKPMPQARKLTRLSLMQAAANLEMFALETDQQEAKELYARLRARIDAILKNLDPYLRDA
jgi:uncharacterized membrane protein YcaP (DUF421 family)